MLEGSDPDEMRAMLDIQMEMMSGELDLIPVRCSTPWRGRSFLRPLRRTTTPADAEPHGMMMGQSTSGNFMIQMRDHKVFDKILDVMTGPEMMGAIVKKDTFMDLDVWTYDPLDAPRVCRTGTGTRTFVDATDDWLVVAMSNDDLKEMIRSSRRGTQVHGQPRNQEGCSSDQAARWASRVYGCGENFATAANVLRPLLGFRPDGRELAQMKPLFFDPLSQSTVQILLGGVPSSLR